MTTFGEMKRNYKMNVGVGDAFDGDIMNLLNVNYPLNYKDVIILLNINVTTRFHSQGYMGNHNTRMVELLKPYIELKIVCVH